MKFLFVLSAVVALFVLASAAPFEGEEEASAAPEAAPEAAPAPEMTAVADLAAIQAHIDRWVGEEKKL